MYAFEDDAPVLWMSPQIPPSAVARKLILWPSWAYTVLAPRVASRPDDRLDVFQESILRLLRADVRDEEELASVVHLDRRLVAYIKAGLRERHLCDDRWAVTERGLRALRDADPEDREICMGFVFQDPGSRVLWGRFVEQLAFQDVTWHSDVPVMMFGSAGNPRPAKSIAIRPPAGAAPMTPRASEILEAVRRHRRAIRFGADDYVAGPVGTEPENIQRVTVISDDPMPVWLGTTLYATDLQDDDSAWSVADPFGLGSSPYLRAEIARRAEDLPALRDALRRLIKPARGDEKRAGYAQRAAIARMDLQERFGVSLASHKDLEDLLADLVIAVERAGEDERDAAGRADAMVRAQRVLEGLLVLTLPSSSDETSTIDLIGDADYDAKLLDARATALGFESLSRGMRFVHAAKIRSVFRRRVGSLRPLALANLLAAAAHADHVFHEAARQKPTLLNDLDSMAAVRDRSAHAGGEPPAQDDLEQIADDVLSMAARIFELHERATPENTHG